MEACTCIGKLREQERPGGRGAVGMCRVVNLEGQ